MNIVTRKMTIFQRLAKIFRKILLILPTFCWILKNNCAIYSRTLYDCEYKIVRMLALIFTDNNYMIKANCINRPQNKFCRLPLSKLKSYNKEGYLWQF